MAPSQPGRQIEILARMNDGVITWDRQWRCTYVNERGAALLGRTVEGVVGTRLDGEFAELVGRTFYEACLRAMRDQVPLQFEAWIPLWDRWFENRVFPSIDGLSVFFTELTDRKRAEAALSESEARLVRAQAVAGIGSWELDLATRTMWASAEAFRIYGVERTSPNLPLEDVQQFPLPEDRPRLNAALAALLAEGTPYDLEFRLRRPADGAIRVVHSLAEAVRDADGRAVKVEGTIQDVTARVAADQERTRLVSAIEQATDIVMIEGPDRTLTYVNPAFSRIYGFTAEVAVGRTPAFLGSGRHSPDFWAERDTVVRAGRTWSGTIVNRRRDGSLVEVDATISPIRGDGGQISGFVQVARDVTAQRALEARLAEAQRMEAIGQLAGGIAHDFNNLLTAIRGFAGLVMDSLPAGEAQNREDLRQIVESADRAAALTQQLLAYSRRLVLDPVVVDPAAVARGVAPLLRRLIGEHIAIELSDEPDLGRVKVDPGQLEQVIVNLAVNARDAMPRGGRLTIHISSVVFGDADPALHPGVSAGQYVRLCVADTGSGMDEATRARIFEPFFTTKASGKGTGMGLATVYGIVTQSGGAIEVESSLGVGTMFTIHLPRVDEPLTEVALQPTSHPSRASGMILLVEDDAAVRSFARRVLEARGYTILEAPAAPEAIEIAEHHRGPLDLLLTDVVMPGPSGPELAERLLAGRPGLRVLYVSGFTEESVVDHGAVTDRIAFLPKPYDAETLVATVRRVLAS